MDRYQAWGGNRNHRSTVRYFGRNRYNGKRGGRPSGIAPKTPSHKGAPPPTAATTMATTKPHSSRSSRNKVDDSDTAAITAEVTSLIRAADIPPRTVKSETVHPCRSNSNNTTTVVPKTSNQSRTVRPARQQSTDPPQR